MSRIVKDALIYARDLLWDLLVQQERGDIQIGDDNRAQVDQCQRLCEQALKELESPETSEE